MMLDLKVKSTCQCSSNESTIGRRCLDLGFEPAYSLPVFAKGFGRVAIDVFEIMGKGEQ